MVNEIQRGHEKKQMKVNKVTHKTKLKKLEGMPGLYSPVDHICWQLGEDLKSPKGITALFSPITANTTVTCFCANTAVVAYY